MRTLNLVQGSPEWNAHRAKHSNASDAPAMMGAGKYQTRSALIHAVATGHSADVDENTQRLFDRGHAAEAAIRPHVEKIVGDDLYPATGESDEYPWLSASFDGITMDETVIFEHKLWNEDLAKAVQAGELDMHYIWQLEQQLLVSGAEKAIFVTSDGTPEKMAYYWYSPVAGRREALLAGWAQFEKDVAAYVPEAAAAPVVATAIMDLPAVNVQIEGALQVLSNLPAWGDRLRDFIGGLNPAPESDQDFADAENEIKVLKRAEDELEAAETRALSQIAVVDEMRKLKAMLHKLARDTRLAREKLVKDRKDIVRREIQQAAVAQIAAHLTAHNERWGKPYMPQIAYDVAGAMKGKKTMKSLKDAASVEVARAKIEADRIAKIIDANIATLRDKAGAHKFLFNDTSSLVLKDPEAVAAIVDQRIAAHEAEQRAKVEAAAEAAREKIRKEEQEKAERAAREQAAREAAAKAEAERVERDRLEAERQRAEEQERQAREAAEPTCDGEHGGSRCIANVCWHDDAPTVELALADAIDAGLSEEPLIRADDLRGEQVLMPMNKPAAPAAPVNASRPTDAAIIKTLASAFGVRESVALGWIRTMNLADLGK